jgi:hypothetical protein
MPIRKVSKSNGGTTHIVGDVSTGTKTKVKKITVGRPVRRVLGADGSLKTLSDIFFESPHPEDGDVLVYHESDEKWHAQKLLDKQVINGGQY